MKKTASLKTVIQRLNDRNYIYEIRSLGNKRKLYPDKMEHMEMYVYGCEISPYEVSCPYTTGKTKRAIVYVGLPVKEVKEIYSEIRVEKGNCVSTGWLNRAYGSTKAEQIIACCLKIGYLKPTKRQGVYAFA